MDNGDAFKKVRSGEPLVIPANFYNAVVDGLAWIKSQQTQQTAHGGTSENQRLVVVKNDSGADVADHSILGISGVLFDPATNTNTLAAFKAEPGYVGIVPAAPDHVGRFVVTAEPIKAGRLGMAYVTGACAVKVKITDSAHWFADVADGEMGFLASGPTGSAAILWKQSPQGDDIWCSVRLAGGGGDAEFLAQITSSDVIGNAGNRTWKYSLKRCQKIAPGLGSMNWEQFGDTFEAFNQAEVINPDSALKGNGVNLANLLGSYDLIPIPIGQVAWVRQMAWNDGGDPGEPGHSGTEYFIVGMGVPNGVDGQCPDYLTPTPTPT